MNYFLSFSFSFYVTLSTVKSLHCIWIKDLVRKKEMKIEKLDDLRSRTIGSSNFFISIFFPHQIRIKCSLNDQEMGILGETVWEKYEWKLSGKERHLSKTKKYIIENKRESRVLFLCGLCQVSLMEQYVSVFLCLEQANLTMVKSLFPSSDN